MEQRLEPSGLYRADGKQPDGVNLILRIEGGNFSCGMQYEWTRSVTLDKAHCGGKQEELQPSQRRISRESMVTWTGPMYAIQLQWKPANQ